MSKPRPLRILYGITKSNFGGAQRYVYDLALAAKREGSEVAVLCGGEGVLKEKLEAAGIPIFSLPLTREVSTLADSRSFFSILEVLEKFKPDVFHINSSKMGGIGALAGRIMRVKKIIFTAHGWAFNEARPFWQKIIIKFLVWVTILFSHKTICVSDETCADVGSYPFIRRKLKIIHNGIANFPLMPRREARPYLVSEMKERALLVGTISELHKVKGLDVLLKAWKDLPRSSGDRLVIIGEGDERQNLQNMAQTLGISSSVHFRGFLNNAREYLSGLDIFVLPSRSEALGYVILEAGYAKLPVIAARVGGIPEIIKNGITGLLVPKESVAHLTYSLNKLFSDKPLRKELGENLYQWVREKFSQEEMIRETFSLYL